MVTRLFFLLIFIPLFLFSGEFVATVSRNQVNVGESFTLNLTLKDVDAKSSPNTDFLKGLFSVHSQQQMQNTNIVNGHFSSSIVWKLTLIPLKEGKVEIPSIGVDTSEGLLSSSPIMIDVVKGSATGANGSSEPNEMVLTSVVSNPNPYKNEPIVYSIKIVSKRNLANISMDKLNLDNAIVESNGDPKVYNSVVDGVNVGIIVFEYLITPLKAGELIIPSTVIHGVIPIQREAHARNEMDLFSMMRGYDQLKPFALTTETTLVNVKVPVDGMNPWLPAKSLTLEEVWNESQVIQAGEPITRSFNIAAEGIKSSQLPSINDLQANDSNVKIYADKPELNDVKTPGNIKSSRKEQFTIIPQKAGELVLPELSIAWWDVTKNEKAIAKIPARTLQVLPAAQNPHHQNAIAALDTPIPASFSNEIVVQRDPILYAIIVVLSILLLAVVLWAIILQRKISNLKKVKSVKKAPINYEKYAPKKLPTKDKQEKLPDLNPT